MTVFGITYCISHLCIFEGSQGCAGELGDEGSWNCLQFWRQHRELLYRSLKQREGEQMRELNLRYCSGTHEGKVVPWKKAKKTKTTTTSEDDKERMVRRWISKQEMKSSRQHRKKVKNYRRNSSSEKHKDNKVRGDIFKHSALERSSQCLRINAEEDRNHFSTSSSSSS